jgi:hypothetical protein
VRGSHCQSVTYTSHTIANTVTGTANATVLSIRCRSDEVHSSYSVSSVGLSPQRGRGRGGVVAVAAPPHGAAQVCQRDQLSCLVDREAVLLS